MSEKKEFSSSSLKDAIARAAAEFEVDEEQLKYEIITEKTHYFGHSQREIYIRAWLTDGTDEEALSAFVKELLKGMEMELDFQVSYGKGFVKVDFSGADYKLMLYQNGSLLNAVQYILNRLFSDDLGKKVYCECERFRRKKEFELTNQANRYARMVRKTGRPVVLKDLNPFERRVIHVTVNKYADLESKSYGDTFQKDLTIKRK